MFRTLPSDSLAPLGGKICAGEMMTNFLDGAIVLNSNQAIWHQMWGLLKLRSLISPQAKFSILQKYLLDYLGHI